MRSRSSTNKWKRSNIYECIIEGTFKGVYIVIRVRLELESLFIPIQFRESGIDIQAQLTLRVEILTELVE